MQTTNLLYKGAITRCTMGIGDLVEIVARSTCLISSLGGFLRTINGLISA